MTKAIRENNERCRALRLGYKLHKVKNKDQYWFEEVDGDGQLNLDEERKHYSSDAAASIIRQMRIDNFIEKLALEG